MKALHKCRNHYQHKIHHYGLKIQQSSLFTSSNLYTRKSLPPLLSPSQKKKLLPPGFNGKPYEPFFKTIVNPDPGLLVPIPNMDNTLFATDTPLTILKDLPDFHTKLYPLRTFDDNGNILSLKELRDKAHKLKIFVKLSKLYDEINGSCYAVILQELDNDKFPVDSIVISNPTYNNTVMKLKDIPNINKDILFGDKFKYFNPPYSLYPDFWFNKLIRKQQFKLQNEISYGPVIDIYAKKNIDELINLEKEQLKKELRLKLLRSKGMIPYREEDGFNTKSSNPGTPLYTVLEYLLSDDHDIEINDKSANKENENKLENISYLKDKIKIVDNKPLNKYSDKELKDLYDQLENYSMKDIKKIFDPSNQDLDYKNEKGNLKLKSILKSKSAILKILMGRKIKLEEDKNLEFRGPHFKNIEIDFINGGFFVDKPQTLIEDIDNLDNNSNRFFFETRNNLFDNPERLNLEKPEMNEIIITKNEINYNKLIDDIPPESAISRNIIGIQMLPFKTNQKVFPGLLPSCNNTFMIDHALNDLQNRGLLDKIGDPIYSKELPLPDLAGRTIIEHFSVLGEEQIRGFNTLIQPLLSMKKKPRKPYRWKWRSGWTRYWWNENDNIMKEEPVDCPQEFGIVFDVETFYKNSGYAAIATAMSDQAWYSWISPSYFSTKPGPPTELISFGDPDVPRVIIGYNLGYDRARVKEEYALKSTKFYFLDIMSLHMAVAGLSTQQIGLWKRRKAESIKDKLEYPNKILLKDSYRKWWDYAEMGGLKSAAKLHLNVDLSKKVREWFKLNYRKLYDKNFYQIATNYCSEDVDITMDLFKVLYDKYTDKCPDPISLLGPLQIGKSYLTVGKSWTNFIDIAEAKYTQLLRLIDMHIYVLVEGYSTLKQEEWEKDPWLRELDWRIPIKRAMLPEGVPGYLYTNSGQYRKRVQSPELADKPQWYRNLYNRKEGRVVVTLKTQIIPYILKLSWDGKPVFKTKQNGWVAFVDKNSLEEKLLRCNRKGIPEGSITFSAHPRSRYFDKESAKDKSKWFFPIDNPESKNGKTTNLISRGFLKFAEKGRLTAIVPEIFEMLREQAKASYWTSLRDRVRQQLMVWKKEEGELSLDEKLKLKKYKSKWNIGKGNRTLKLSTYPELNKDFDSPDNCNEHGVILPQTTPMGTVTRRAVERSWMTASNPDEERLASEMKTQVVAPHGYKIIGADVDSEELWLASIIGDSIYGVHGATPIGFMTLQGTKKAKTDVHSVTAGLLGIDRNDAKVFNYSRIYGSGVSHAVSLLKQQDPKITEKLAREKAKFLYEKTKGKEALVYNKTNYSMKHEDQFVPQRIYYGGTESMMFNALDMFGLSDCARTPALLCEISDSLRGEYLPQSDEFGTTRVNWIIQSSGVDYLHLLIVAMEYLMKRMKLDGRFMITIHDEIRYLFKDKDADKACVALQVANIWVRCFISAKLGMNSLPLSAAYFSAVDVDHVLRKEPTYVFPDHKATKAHIPGQAFSVQDTIQRLGEDCREEILFGPELPSIEYVRREMGIEKPLTLQEEVEYTADDKLHAICGDIYQIRNLLYSMKSPTYQKYKEHRIYRDYLRDNFGLKNPLNNALVKGTGYISCAISAQDAEDSQNYKEVQQGYAGPYGQNMFGLYNLHDFIKHTPVSRDYLKLMVKATVCQSDEEFKPIQNDIEKCPSRFEHYEEKPYYSLSNEDALIASLMYNHRNSNYYWYKSAEDADLKYFKLKRAFQRQLFIYEHGLHSKSGISSLEAKNYLKWCTEYPETIISTCEKVAEVFDEFYYGKNVNKKTYHKEGEREKVEKAARNYIATEICADILFSLFGVDDIKLAVNKYPYLRKMLNITNPEEKDRLELLKLRRERKLNFNSKTINNLVINKSLNIKLDNVKNQNNSINDYDKNLTEDLILGIKGKILDVKEFENIEEYEIDIPVYFGEENTAKEIEIYLTSFKSKINPNAYKSADFFIYSDIGKTYISENLDNIFIFERTFKEHEFDQKDIFMLNYGIEGRVDPTESEDENIIRKMYGRESVNDYEVPKEAMFSKESTMLETRPDLMDDQLFINQRLHTRLRLFFKSLKPGDKYAILSSNSFPYFMVGGNISMKIPHSTKDNENSNEDTVKIFFLGNRLEPPLAPSKYSGPEAEEFSASLYPFLDNIPKGRIARSLLEVNGEDELTLDRLSPTTFKSYVEPLLIASTKEEIDEDLLKHFYFRLTRNHEEDCHNKNLIKSLMKSRDKDDRYSLMSKIDKEYKSYRSYPWDLESNSIEDTDKSHRRFSKLVLGLKSDIKEELNELETRKLFLYNSYIGLIDFLTDPNHPEREVILDLLPLGILSNLMQTRQKLLYFTCFGDSELTKGLNKVLCNNAIEPPEGLNNNVREYLEKKSVIEFDPLNEKRLENLGMLENKDIGLFDTYDLDKDTYFSTESIISPTKERAEILNYLRVNGLNDKQSMSEMIQSFADKRAKKTGFFVGPLGEFYVLKKKFDPSVLVKPLSLQYLANENENGEGVSFDLDDEDSSIYRGPNSRRICF